ncbi:MAG TPA: SpaA isopeptide-forming pilin-related protein, partial [Thermomicrobiales bacterium]|nr:SpaA isopeptide-forming pilin-related protein [Thermomicrobiales bacterium]
MRVPGHIARTRRGTLQRSRSSQARWLNAVTAMLLLAGLLANFVTIAPLPVAAQQKDNTPPPYPTPQSVVAVGSFQTAVGCGQDFDKDCDLTQLQANSDGTWTGTFQIPAGSYTYRIVTRSDIDRSFGKDGDPNGDDISLDVPDGALGVFFSFNEWTGEIYAVPVTNQIELSTDLGQFPMQPNKDGGAFAVIDAQPNSSFGAHVILDGNPVGDVVTVDTGDSGRVVVTMDQNGSLKSDSVEQSTLTVTKTDADGNPLPGACFSVYDGKDVAGQGCDSSDGEDGSTRIEFPVGAGNGLELRETRTPDGQERADSQDIDLNPGDNQVTVTAGGGGGQITPPEEETATAVEEETPTEEVTPELGTITLYTVDENGNPVPGVCYTVSSYSDVQCDEDGDGDMGLTDVPAGDYTAQQASVPDGYQLDNQEQTITVSGGEEATGTFTSPTTQAQTFTVTVTITDQDGNPVPGACFTVTDANANQGSEQCDDDQNGDVQFDLANGDYTLSMTTTPDGYETAEDQSFTVSDQDVDLQVSVNAVAPSETATTGGEGNGAINVSVTDQDGFAIIGACVTIQGPTSGEVCDNGDGDANGEDGLIRIENLPDGDYTVTVSQLP